MGKGSWEYSDANPQYRAYIHSKEWKAKREKRLGFDKGICCVCGGEATEVHHLTYDRFKNEDLNDLVSLCHECHQKAESIYNPKDIPWAIDEKHILENGKKEDTNFMAAMRVDAARVSPVVFDYILAKRGRSLDALFKLWKPTEDGLKRHFEIVKRAVNALCAKRYYLNCQEDRRVIMIESISVDVIQLCLSQIEHYAHNGIQAEFCKIAKVAVDVNGTQVKAAQALGISAHHIGKFCRDDGTSFGPSLRETVLYYCGVGAAAGIRPVRNFKCLTVEDYQTLNAFADYMCGVSGMGPFKGEYSEASTI